MFSQGGGTGNLPAAGQSPESIVLREVPVVPDPVQQQILLWQLY